MKSIREYIKEKYNKNNETEIVFFNFNEDLKNVKAIKYRAGRVGKVFAFYGKPETPKPICGYPAVLLIHGGQGYAYYEWVKRWTDRGYVAIAPDYDSHFAIDENNRQELNPLGGPRGYGSVFETESDEPWIYFSVLSSIKAIDVICEDTEVDKSKIVLDGISWGGFAGLKLLAVEKRIKAATIKYSSAFIAETTWGQDEGLKYLTSDQLSVYNEYFDPQNDLRRITAPILFAAGTDDKCFMMKTRKKTTDAVCSRLKAFGYRLHYDHGHFEGWKTSESIDFADSVLNGLELSRLKIVSSEHGKVVIKAEGEVSDMTLCYTVCDFYDTEKCVWNEIAVEMEFVLPENVTAYFITYVADFKTRYSTDVFIIGQKKPEIMREC